MNKKSTQISIQMKMATSMTAFTKMRRNTAMVLRHGKMAQFTKELGLMVL